MDFVYTPYETVETVDVFHVLMEPQHIHLLWSSIMTREIFNFSKKRQPGPQPFDTYSPTFDTDYT